MPPLLRRILKLHKISAKHVLNNKGKKFVNVNAFLLAASKSYPLTNFSKLRKLVFTHGYHLLSLAEYDFHTKNDQIYNIFKCKKIIFLLRKYPPF